MRNYGTHFKTDGTVEKVYPKNGKTFEYDELNGFVGGYIEIVSLQSGLMVVNEEGKLNDLPYNHNATLMFNAEIGGSDYIVGDALVCPHNMIE